MRMSLLEVTGLCKYFGGLAAINNLDLTIEEGEIHGVIGPNGAGKTTFFNVVSGIYRPNAGQILFEGTRISGLKPSKIAEMGVVRTFQREAFFPKFTVIENVSVGRHLHAKEGIFDVLFASRRANGKGDHRKAWEIVELLGLADAGDDLAANLPHGHQRALGVAIALAAEPKLLMLDEPVSGMNPIETQHMMGLIRKIRDDWGITILLVEHDMRTVMGLCEKITVLDFGQKLAEGSPGEIQGNKLVIEAYLGAEDIVAQG